MDAPRLPPDLVKFISEGRQLEYDPATCEAGLVYLYGLSGLKLRTFGAHCRGTTFEQDDPEPGRVYRVQGVDLVAACTGDYEPEGC